MAAVLTAVEGFFFLAYAVLELLHFDGSRAVMGLTTTAFFAGYGAALLLCARGLGRGHSWARGPVVMTQMIQLMVAWGFRGGSTTWVAVIAVLWAVVVVAALLAPASTRRLAE